MIIGKCTLTLKIITYQLWYGKRISLCEYKTKTINTGIMSPKNSTVHFLTFRTYCHCVYVFRQHIIKWRLQLLEKYDYKIIYWVASQKCNADYLSSIITDIKQQINHALLFIKAEETIQTTINDYIIIISYTNAGSKKNVSILSISNVTVPNNLVFGKLWTVIYNIAKLNWNFETNKVVYFDNALTA